MRSVAVITVARSDYGLYHPVLGLIVADPTLELQLVVAGTHFSSVYGRTASAIEADGFAIAERIDMTPEADTAEGAAVAAGAGIAAFARFYARNKPDIVLVLGDRYEMLAAVVAALPFNIPVAHIHGGELTEGAIDDAARHAITKMSHLHFVSTEAYATRVRRLGEEPWRVTVSGAPFVDTYQQVELLDRVGLRAIFGLDIPERFLLVTYHPVSRQNASTDAQMDALLGALDSSKFSVFCTYPNADVSGLTIIKRIEAYVAGHDNAQAAANLGTQGYFSLMSLATAMVGNSSSGINEAPSLRLPVVNIGPRQQGRMRAANVVDVECKRTAIETGIAHATSDAFRDSLRELESPYGDGHAAERIVDVLANVPINERLLIKPFYQGAI